jgi:parvulin-like peptidyl-prolyl isomerase
MKLQVTAWLVTLVLTAGATAQVASHAPSASRLAPVSVSDKPVARVNGAVLTERDLIREMYAIFPYARVHNGFPKAQEAQIRRGALDMIVFDELLYQEAKRRGLSVGAQRVTAGLRSYQQEFSTRDEYNAYLRAECQGSEKILRGRIRRSLLIDTITQTEIESKSVITEAYLRSYYAKNGRLFMEPEMFEFQSISILPPRDGKKEHPLEQKKRAENIFQKARATKTYEDFGLLAEKISDDDFRVDMGKHKPVAAAELPPAVVNALRGLKPGEVSGLIEVEKNAYTIVRLKSHVPAGKKSLSAVKADLKKELTARRKEQLRSVLAAKLKASAKIEIL